MKSLWPGTHVKVVVVRRIGHCRNSVPSVLQQTLECAEGQVNMLKCKWRDQRTGVSSEQHHSYHVGQPEYEPTRRRAGRLVETCRHVRALLTSWRLFAKQLFVCSQHFLFSTHHTVSDRMNVDWKGCRLQGWSNMTGTNCDLFTHK